MAVHTLKAKYETKDNLAGRVRRIFFTSKDQKDIYSQFEGELEAAPGQDSPAEAANPAPASVGAAPAVNAAPPATAGPATSIEDVPIRAVDILALIVSQKLKKQLSEILLSKSIKELPTANRRFKTRSWATFKASFHPPLTRVRSFRWRCLALPLDLVILAISASIQLVLCRRAIGGKMPGGFNISSTKAHLSKTWGLAV